jgi:hypothetical protein
MHNADASNVGEGGQVAERKVGSLVQNKLITHKPSLKEPTLKLTGWAFLMPIFPGLRTGGWSELGGTRTLNRIAPGSTG